MAMSPTLTTTILTHLAAFFLTAALGDPTAARDAAAQMLAAYTPETEDELRLAAQIISFSFHSLEALSQATTPGMPLTRILRLRGSAVSLSRESHKAQRRLDQLQAARRAGTPAQPAAPEPASPRIDNALNLIAETKTIAATAKTNQQTWTQAYNQRQREQRLLARQLKTEARQATLSNHPDPALSCPHGAT